MTRLAQSVAPSRLGGALLRDYNTLDILSLYILYKSLRIFSIVLGENALGRRDVT